MRAKEEMGFPDLDDESSDFGSESDDAMGDATFIRGAVPSSEARGLPKARISDLEDHLENFDPAWRMLRGGDRKVCFA